MARYIDADKFAKDLAEACVHKAIVFSVLNRQPTADVVPKSEEGAECPTCYGTGRIGTTNWLTQNMTKKQIAEEKAQAIAEHEQYIKTEYAREIFEEIEKILIDSAYIPDCASFVDIDKLAELKKKYTE